MIGKYKTLAIVVGFVAFLALPTPKTHAISILQPFGGKIILTTMPGVSCSPNKGPITIKPVNIAPPSPYVITPLTKSYNNNVNIGNWIIGLYSPIPLPLCTVGGGFLKAPIPVPVLPIIMYGTN